MDSVDITKELIKIPSCKNDDNAIYSYVFDLLKDNGLSPFKQTIENPYNSTGKLDNIYVLVEGSKKGPSVILNGHLDTVVPVDGWFYSPYSGREEDGKIYGLGAADMKAGCATLIKNIVRLNKMKDKLKGKVFLSLVFGEEEPFSFGTDILLREFHLKNYDVCLIPEPSPLLSHNSYCITHKKVHDTKFPVLITGAEGRVLFEIEFIGRASHASQPSLGINAIHDASRLINALLNFDFFSNIKMGRGEYTTLKFEGFTKGFSVPEYCKLEINRHLVIGEDPRDAIREIKRIIKKLKLKSKVNISKKFSPTPEHEYLPYIFEDNKYIDKFLELLPSPKKGKKKCRLTTRSVGDFNFFARRTKVPTLVFGPGGGNIHSSNEFVYKQDIYDTEEYIYDFLTNILT